MVARIVDNIAALHVAQRASLTIDFGLFEDIALQLFGVFKNTLFKIKGGKTGIFIAPIKNLHRSLPHPEVITFLSFDLFISLLSKFSQLFIVKIGNRTRSLDYHGF